MKPFIGNDAYVYDFNEVGKVIDYIEAEDLYLIELPDGLVFGYHLGDFKIVHYDIINAALDKNFPNAMCINFTEKVVPY